MKIRCTFDIKSDGTVDIKWKNLDVIKGGPAAQACDMIRAYISFALMFATEMGGLEQAYKIMQDHVHRLRQIVEDASTDATPTGETSDVLVDPAPAGPILLTDPE